MNILLSSIAVKNKPNGVYSRSINIARGLVNNRNKVTLLMISPKFDFPYKKEIIDGILIISIPSLFGQRYSKFGYSIVSTIIRILYMISRKDSYDIVHSDQHRPVCILPCLIYRLFYKKSRFVADWQDLFGEGGMYDNKSKRFKKSIGRLDNWLEKYNVIKADGVVPFSKYLHERAIGLGKSSEKLFKIWGGSDVEKIRYISDPNRNRYKFNLANNAFVLIFSSMEEMDIERNILFFKVLKEIHAEDRNIVLAKTGKVFSESFKQKYRIGDEIIEVGEIDYELYGEFLSCANAFVLVQGHYDLNDIARWPNVVGDYLAAGRPIIMNIVGELEELERDFSDAILSIHPENGADCLFEELMGIVKNRANLERVYGDINTYATTRFSWQLRANQLYDFFREINPHITD